MSASAENTTFTLSEQIEVNRLKFLKNLQELIKDNLTTCYSSIGLITQVLYNEIEDGSKELAIFRELHSTMLAGKMTEESWQDINNRLLELRKEKEYKVKAAKERL